MLFQEFMSVERDMWIEKFLMVSFIFILVAEPAKAAGSFHERGRVNMQGTIIDTACSIAVESQEQTVDMDIVPLADIIRDGHGQTTPFSIELVNCVAKRSGKEDWKPFQVTFEGDAEGRLFGVQGEASGVALQITDAYGNIAAPGTPLPSGNIRPGNMRLDYRLKLMANNHALKSGDYFSSVRFRLDYF